MSGWITPLLRIVPVLLLAACAYAPPNQADTARPSYRTDLAACQTSGEAEAHRLVMGHGGYFLTYPLSTWMLDRREIGKCMAAKGYAASQ